MEDGVTFSAAEFSEALMQLMVAGLLIRPVEDAWDSTAWVLDHAERGGEVLTKL
jgi:hypothetical protein